MSEQINADFSQFVVAHTNDMEWQQSPTAGSGENAWN